MGTEESRSVSLRVQLSTAPMSLVPMRSTATRGVVCGSSPLRRRQFRLLIWSSAARPRASQIQCGRPFTLLQSARPGLASSLHAWTRLDPPGWRCRACVHKGAGELLSNSVHDWRLGFTWGALETRARQGPQRVSPWAVRRLAG